MKELRPYLIRFNMFQDARGSLTVAKLLFIPKRVFWIYDVEKGATRSDHAHTKEEQILVALAGQFDVNYFASCGVSGNVKMKCAEEGLYIPRLTWTSLSNFSRNAVCLVISSTEYNQNDFIKEWKWFEKNIFNK